MSTTEDRIESLENQLRDQQSQVRRQRRWNIALGAVVVVGGLMAATGVRSVPDVIQAKKFEVVGDRGDGQVEDTHRPALIGQQDSKTKAAPGIGRGRFSIEGSG